MAKRFQLPGRVLTVVLALVLCMSMAVSVCAAVLGDLNSDNVVTTDDVVQLLLHLSMPGMFEIDGHGDFNGDGNLDTEDAVQLLLHISMPDLFPLTPGESGSDPAVPEDGDIEIPIPAPDGNQSGNVIDFDDLLNAGKN